MSLRLPGGLGEEGTEPVFEHFFKTAAGGELLMRRFNLRCDPRVFGALAPFYEIWRAKLHGEQLPRWRDFSFEEFVGWHRRVALSDIGSERPDLRFRIFASAAVELHGEDLTGKWLTESIPEAERDGVIEHFGHIRDERLIGFLVGRIGKKGREFLNFKVIELPLVNEEGRVTQILHAFGEPLSEE